MLKEEIVESVGKGEFHIYPVETIEEGIEILTGKIAGKIEENGEFTENSVFSRVDEKLSHYVQMLNLLSAKDSGENREAPVNDTATKKAKKTFKPQRIVSKKRR
jgi:hypothetical protein